MNSYSDVRTSVRSAVLPVIRGARWFGQEHGPYVLRVELRLTLDEMVAGLYGVAETGDIGSTEDLCGSVVVTLLAEGLTVLQERVAKIRVDEQDGTIQAPEYLEYCRRRVAALLSVCV
jgi:hypothetical protein